MSLVTAASRYGRDLNETSDISVVIERRRLAVGSGSGKRGRKKAGHEPVLRAAPESAGKPTYDDWVWWPNTEGRRSPALKEFRKFPPAVQGEMAALIQRFLKGESRRHDMTNMGQGLKELRYRTGNNHYRILFFVADGRLCVALTCFYKNQNKTEQTDLERAKTRRDSY